MNGSGFVRCVVGNADSPETGGGELAIVSKVCPTTEHKSSLPAGYRCTSYCRIDLFGHRILDEHSSGNASE